jgi:calcineurin-like phosphoesterase family protein
MKRWVISDTHFGHENIIKYCDRPFSCKEEMDEILIRNWNKTVSNDDVVYFLGDFCFGRPGREVSRSYRSKLNGRIHLIRGNHDRYIDESIFESAQDSIVLEINDKAIYLCHYPEQNNIWKIPPHDFYLYGHVHNKFSFNPRKFNMCVENCDYTPIDLDFFVDFISRNYGDNYEPKDS